MIKPQRQSRYSNQDIDNMTLEHLEAMINFFEEQPWEDVQQIIQENL